MDDYIQVCEELLGFIKKKTQIGDIHMFLDRGENLRGVLIPENIEREAHQARNFNFTLRLIAPYDFWKQLIQKMGIIENQINNCTLDTPLVKFRCHTEGWERVEDETNIIYEFNIIVRGVRLGI